MASFYDQHCLSKLSYFSKAAATISSLVGIFVIAGWAFDIPVFKSVIPGLTAMNPGGTALAFIFAGISLLSQQNENGRPGLKLLGRFCAFLILLIALSWFVGHFLHMDHGPDQMLFRHKLELEAAIAGHTNRMAPNTATAFALVGLALFFLDVKIRNIWLAQILALGGTLIALLALIGYAYSSMALAGVGHFIPMALNTATLFLLINTAILSARPERGLVSVISSAGLGGRQARLLLPLVIIIPAIIGELEKAGGHVWTIDPALQKSTFILANIVIFMALIWWNAILLEKADQSRRQAENGLQKAKEAAENASRTKSDFLANMSHELRTPLNSIIGLSRMLFEDEGLSEDHRDMVGITYRSANGLLDIVNDILDLSKIEADALEFEKIIFAPQEVISGVMEIFLPLCSQKGLILSCNLPAGTKLPYLVGDPTRLSRIIVNLVSNAVKYTERGSVTIDINWTADKNGKMHFSCRVTDTGIGIPADKLNSIFDKFVQADASITRKYGGTGLGLNITKYLVEKMGGEIGVTSTMGEGSCFWFSIPFEAAKSRPVFDKRAFLRSKIDRLPPEQRKKAEDIHILIGEDHLLNQAFMKRLLPKIGFEKFDIVDNGQMVLDALKNKEYDLILMDCHMPIISGYGAVEQLRKREEGTDRHIPVIAMTADAMAGTREKCLVAGMDDYISKPLSSDELKLIIGRWITFPDEGGSTTSPASILTKDEGPSLKAFANNDEELNQLVSLFIQQSEESLNTLKNNCVDGKNENWVEEAHKLKGSAAAAKAKKLETLCSKAQKMEGATARERKAILNEISAAYNKVKDALLSS